MATETTLPPVPTLEDWQHWTSVMGRAQQMLMETASIVKANIRLCLNSPPLRSVTKEENRSKCSAHANAG